MEDDNRSEDPPENRPPTGSDRPEEGGQGDTPPSQDTQPRRPPSRLDRLMGAKDHAEKNSSVWSEIEQLGLPVQSQDQAGPESEPLIPEPPREPGDTPGSQGTPPRGVPPVRESAEPAGQPPVEEAPPAQETPPAQDTPQRISAAARRGLPSPSFPHPTDQPFAPPPGTSPPSPPPDLMAEPPPPDDFGSTPRRSEPSRSAPRREAQPPPESIGEVRMDEHGMPLPRRVTQEDLDATMVGESAYRDDVFSPSTDHTLPHPRTDPPAPEPPPSAYDYEDTVRHAPVQRPAPPPPAPPPTAPRAMRRAVRQPAPRAARQPVPRRAPPKRSARRKPARKPLSWSCLTRVLMLLFVGGIVSLMLGGGGAAIYYSQVTAPSFRGIRTIDDLQARAIQFQTTRIRDRDGNILYEINDPEGGFRDYVTLDEVSPWVIVATVATEERGYFTNPGFSVPAIGRAVVQNLREGEVVSGASTITQQLTRALLLPEEERAQRTYSRKIKEAFLAAELDRRFDKQEILELYLNQIYYGNLAYGIEAAARTYFGKSARDLNLAEAAFLAGLPQAPAVWDPVTNKSGALLRQQQVLGLMLEQGCADPGRTGLILPCTTTDEIAAAQPDLIAVAQREYRAPRIQARYPHWVVYVQQLLEADPTIGPAIYTSGFDVYTTLDPRLQDIAQENVESTLAGLADRNVGNASVVVIDVDTGAILAMVGSRNFHDESISGQVNIPLTLQQPGSSIKPFTYLAAFRQGWTPATVIWDVPIEYSIPGFGVYAPANYDGRFRGPVSVRSAIANSLNVPAVLTLDHVGVPALLQVLNDVGISSLGDPSNPNNYGLSLTLGAGEVYLLEWTNAFAIIANGGVYRPTYAIDRIERNGVPVEGYPYQVPPGNQVLDPGHAYLMQNILSDKVARIPGFGENTPLSPPYTAGAKTGTTNDFRDNWTMGFTTEIAVGVWVGNTDNAPMVNVTGVTGAGPIWRGVMDGAVQFYPPQEFPRPPGVFPQSVCRDDGTLADGYTFCVENSTAITELFVFDPPGAEARLYRELEVDQFSGLLANDYCSRYTEARPYLVLPNASQLIDMRPFIRSWLLNSELGQGFLASRGIPPEVVMLDPPDQACGPDTPQPNIAITAPQEGSTQENIVTVYGTVDVPNFSHYRVEFGVSHEPLGWGIVQGDTSQRVTDNALGQIDLSAYEDGPITIRVLVFDTEGHSAEERVHFTLAKPPPPPEPEDE